jgi:hypothetical protein
VKGAEKYCEPDPLEFELREARSAIKDQLEQMMPIAA